MLCLLNSLPSMAWGKRLGVFSQSEAAFSDLNLPNVSSESFFSYQSCLAISSRSQRVTTGLRHTGAHTRTRHRQDHSHYRKKRNNSHSEPSRSRLLDRQESVEPMFKNRLKAEGQPRIDRSGHGRTKEDQQRGSGRQQTQWQHPKDSSTPTPATVPMKNGERRPLWQHGKRHPTARGNITVI